MLSRLSFLFFLLLLTLALAAQCPADDVTLLSQAEINAFAADFPNCTELESLTIGRLAPLTDITDLSGLSNLTAAFDRLEILGTQLIELDGLDPLVTTKRIKISNNPELTGLGALENVSSAVDLLIITKNHSLTTIEKFSQFDITGQVSVQDNSQLEECSFMAFCNALNSPDVSVTFARNRGSCFNSTAVSAACGIEICSPDYAQLMTFYYYNGGPQWTNKNGWEDGFSETTCDVCNWEGITCEGGQVTHIELRDNNLSGPLDPSTNKLPGLKVVNLSLNDLGGTLPDLSSLTNMLDFRCGSCDLSGPFPTDFFSMPDLNWLELGNNEFSGLIPDLGNMPSLVRLFLNGNNFNGPLPFLNDNDRLSILSLFNNDLSGEIHGDYNPVKLPRLVLLRIDGNNLEGGLPAELAELPRLTNLNASNNNFSGCYPEEYDAFCGGLRLFNFSGNPELPDGGDSDWFTNTFCPDPAGACLALPANWRYFTAEATGKTVSLRWGTVQEENTAYFSIERSRDGREWTGLGRQSAAGWASAERDYQYLDPRPQTGANYYRLGLYDTDGLLSYGEVRQVNFTATDAAWPNPFREELRVNSSDAQRISVYNLSGREVLAFEHAGGGAQVQSLELPAGVYVLRFGNTGRSIRLIRGK